MDCLCRKCHASIAVQTAEAGQSVRCPACGSEGIANFRLSLDPADGPPPQIDHRGIVLPGRHAVGGVITPR